MKVYWQTTRPGQRLVLVLDDGNEEEIGGVRSRKAGFDAFAKAAGYDPGRARKGIPSIEEARAFVESFTPWELYEGAVGLVVESEIKADSG